MKNNGLVTITNIDKIDTTITRYKYAQYVQKSFQHSVLIGTSGERINFLNTHTEYSPSHKSNRTHLSQIQQISHYIKSLTLRNENNIIMVGDFNVGPEILDARKDYVYSNELWTNIFKPVFDLSTLNHIDIEGFSWDLKKNTLAKRPAFLVRMFNLVKRGTTSWGSGSEMVDHIFVSQNINYSNSSLIFNQHSRLKCRKRYDSDGKVPLSDHYGVKSTVDLL